MGDMTKNFSRSEFKCRCGQCNHFAVDFMLVTAMQEACDYFAAQFNQEVSCKITGPNRCPAHNSKISGASKGSMHQFNCAADHKFFLKQTGHQIEPDTVADYYDKKYFDRYGIGRYSNRTHLDTRPGKARWDVRQTCQILFFVGSIAFFDMLTQPFLQCALLLLLLF